MGESAGGNLAALVTLARRDRRRRDPSAPGLATQADHPDLPPALLPAAGLDPLRDDAVRYAQVLRAAGVEATHVLYPEALHGFASLPSSSRPPGRRSPQSWNICAELGETVQPIAAEASVRS